MPILAVLLTSLVQSNMLFEYYPITFTGILQCLKICSRLPFFVNVFNRRNAKWRRCEYSCGILSHTWNKKWSKFWINKSSINFKGRTIIYKQTNIFIIKIENSLYGATCMLKMNMKILWYTRLTIQPSTENEKNSTSGASLVAQWSTICLSVRGTRVRALLWEDPACRGATGPVSHNYWACASGACAPQQERPR